MILLLQQSTTHPRRVYCFDQDIFLSTVAEYLTPQARKRAANATHLVMHQGTGFLLLNHAAGSMVALATLLDATDQCVLCHESMERTAELGTGGYCLVCGKMCMACVLAHKMEITDSPQQCPACGKDFARVKGSLYYFACLLAEHRQALPGVTPSPPRAFTLAPRDCGCCWPCCLPQVMETGV